MKLSTKPELSSKWWVAERPVEIKGAELEKALENVEEALSVEKKNGDATSVDACIDALETVGTAVERTISKECDQKRHKDAIVVLKKFDDIIKTERRRLAEVQKRLAASDNSDEEEEHENKLFDSEYVCKMMQNMKSTGKELNFCFGLDATSPETSQLLLCKKRKPEMLKRMLKQTGDFQNRQLTYGKAIADPEDGQTLVFRLEENAGEPPQILKFGREFLRSNKGLRFRKLKLVFPSGQTIIDTDPDNDDVALAASADNGPAQDNLGDELATVTKLVNAWEETLKKVSDQIDKLRAALEAQNDPALQTLSKGLGNVMNQFPDLDLNRLVSAAKANYRVEYDQTVKQTAKEIRDVHDLLANGPLLSTIDENPFVKTNVHAWVNAVLQRITDVLNVNS